MEKHYLDKQTIFNTLDKAYCEKCPPTTDCNKCALYQAAELINMMQDENVKPVVKGEWNEIERGGLLIKYALFRCKHCGNIFKVYEDTLNAGRGDKNFCPNCGADMKTEKGKVDGTTE